MEKKEIEMSFTLSEIDALLSTASQMENDLEYYNFLPKDKYKIFINGYKSGIKKLQRAYSKCNETESTPPAGQ